MSKLIKSLLNYRKPNKKIEQQSLEIYNQALKDTYTNNQTLEGKFVGADLIAETLELMIQEELKAISLNNSTYHKLQQNTKKWELIDHENPEAITACGAIQQVLLSAIPRARLAAHIKRFSEIADDIKKHLDTDSSELYDQFYEFTKKSGSPFTERGRFDETNFYSILFRLESLLSSGSSRARKYVELDKMISDIILLRNAFKQQINKLHDQGVKKKLNLQDEQIKHLQGEFLLWSKQVEAFLSSLKAETKFNIRKINAAKKQPNALDIHHYLLQGTLHETTKTHRPIVEFAKILIAVDEYNINKDLNTLVNYIQQLQQVSPSTFVDRKFNELCNEINNALRSKNTKEKDIVIDKLSDYNDFVNNPDLENKMHFSKSEIDFLRALKQVKENICEASDELKPIHEIRKYHQDKIAIWNHERFKNELQIAHQRNSQKKNIDQLQKYSQILTEQIKYEEEERDRRIEDVLRQRTMMTNLSEYSIYSAKKIEFTFHNNPLSHLWIKNSHEKLRDRTITILRDYSKKNFYTAFFTRRTHGNELHNIIIPHLRTLKTPLEIFDYLKMLRDDGIYSLKSINPTIDEILIDKKKINPKGTLHRYLEFLINEISPMVEAQKVPENEKHEKPKLK